MDYKNLQWGYGGRLAPLGNADMTGFSGQATNLFAADDQNAKLLAALGYGGDALVPKGVNPETGFDMGADWNPEALGWLAGQGYQAGVGHQLGSSAGGRPEWWGLLDKSGQFVDGQSDPTYSISSDKPWLEWASMALPLVTMGASMAFSGAGAGAAAGSGLAEGIGTLGAGGTDVAALGSAWSPQAMGLTQAITPGVTGAELAALSASLPELGAVAAGAGGVGTLGGGGSGVQALGPSWSPQALGLTQPITPGITGAELGALSQSLPGAVTPAAGSFRPSQNYGDGMTGAQTSAYDSALGATGSKPVADLVANSGIGSSLTNGIDTISKLVGGGNNLAGLIGGVAGAIDGGKPNTATTQSKTDPRFDQYLYGTGYGDQNSILGAAQKLWQDNRSGLNPTMQQGLDMQRSALLDPAYAQSFQQMRSAGNGLMSQGVAGNPFAQPGGTPGFSGGLLGGGPTAQAGGPGGLLGGSQADRIKALMASGRGLIG